MLIISFDVSYPVSCYNGTITVSMLSTILDDAGAILSSVLSIHYTALYVLYFALYRSEINTAF